jgi:hypothetical protein
MIRFPRTPEQRAEYRRLPSERAALAAALPPEPEPRDCVRSYPVVGSDAVHLVGFDSQGKAQIQIMMERSRLTPLWEQRILKWVRQWDRDRLQLVK